MTDNDHNASDVPAPSDMFSEDVSDLTSALERLRETPRVSDAWRASLASALAEEAMPSLHRRSTEWRARSLIAIAAGFVGVAIGAWSMRGTQVTPSRPLLAESTGDARAVGVRFSIVAPGVRAVSVVGDFNRWNATATPLQLARDGVTWSATLPLPSGRHTYAFVVDGEVMADPAAPSAPENDFGVPNSLLLVSSLK